MKFIINNLVIKISRETFHLDGIYAPSDLGISVINNCVNNCMGALYISL